MDRSQEKSWQDFAKLSQSYNSKYLTGEDRFQMVKDIYLLEGGKIKEDFQSEYQDISNQLATLILRREKNYPWDEFVSNFKKRLGGADKIEIVARDLLIMEQIQKMYTDLVNGKIDEHYKSSNTLEMEAFRIAYYLDFQDKYKNYIV